MGYVFRETSKGLGPAAGRVSGAPSAATVADALPERPAAEVPSRPESSTKNVTSSSADICVVARSVESTRCKRSKQMAVYTVTAGRQLRALGEIALVAQRADLWSYTSLHLNLGALASMPFTDAFTQEDPMPYFIETSQLADGAVEAFAEVKAYLAGTGPETKAVKAIRRQLVSETLKAALKGPEPAEPVAEPIDAPAEPAAAAANDSPDSFGGFGNYGGGYDDYDAPAEADAVGPAGAPAEAAARPAVRRAQAIARPVASAGLQSVGLKRLRSVQRAPVALGKVNVASGLRAFK